MVSWGKEPQPGFHSSPKNSSMASSNQDGYMNMQIPTGQVMKQSYRGHAIQQCEV